MSRRRHRRTIVGLIPQIARGILSLARWVVRHPQPLIAAVVVGVGGWMLWRQVNRLEVFQVTQVHLPADSSLRVPPSLVGTNIWEVDLPSLAKRLKRQQPWLKEVVVMRELPDRLRIDVIKRTMTAQVRLDRWYPVDEEGFIFSRGQSRPSENLVTLRGIETPRSPLQAGRLNTSERLQLALRVLGTLRRSPAMTSRRLEVIDISDPRQINFIVDGRTEIRCGSEAELDEQLDRLRTAFDQVARQQVKVRYIDVRFQEPVVSPRT